MPEFSRSYFFAGLKLFPLFPLLPLFFKLYALQISNPGISVIRDEKRPFLTINNALLIAKTRICTFREIAMDTGFYPLLE
jgi:hypothetical protein